MLLVAKLREMPKIRIKVCFLNDLFILEQIQIYRNVGKILQKIPARVFHAFLLMFASYMSMVCLSQRKTLPLCICGN